VTDGLEVRPAGDRALLLLPDSGVDAVVDRLRGAEVAGLQDVLPAAETVLVTLDGSAEPVAVEERLRRQLADASAAPALDSTQTEPVVIPVRYDGVDLDDVATLLAATTEEVVARHTGRVWRCRFVGFTAGFGYLESKGDDLTVPRRATSRTAVPAGAVGLADGYTAVYPRRSPGGWQLIGTTDAPMWDLERERPALLAPGTLVRFVREG
jgi:KipI family sensor histidine kinase inhibitor